uniref:Uncharacterized protein n=1 Tax=Strigamia maritima TaxID=126957 RepID=T1IGU7_STRMM
MKTIVTEHLCSVDIQFLDATESRKEEIAETLFSVFTKIKPISNFTNLSIKEKRKLDKEENFLNRHQTLFSALTETLKEVPPTREEIISAQNADPYCSEIIQYIKFGIIPKKYHKLKGFKNLVQKYSLDGEMFVFFFPTDDEEIEETGNGVKAVIPPSLRCRVLFACHGHPT